MIEENSRGDFMDTNLKSKIWALLSYIPPMFVLTLLQKNKGSLVKFHAKQAFLLWAIVVCTAPLALLPVFGPALGIVLWSFCAYLLIWAIISAARCETRPMPTLGELVEPAFGVLKRLKSKTP